MIWLYASDNENYSKNGDIALVPNVCEIDTSEWELTLNHPIDEEGRWKSIIEGAVIKVPSFLNNDQLFRIFKKEKSDDGVEVKANPIFFDSANDTMLIDVRPTDKNGQQALDILTQNTKYSGSSDIDNISTAYYQYKNLMEALMSDDENSFINRWGGEVLYDNFNVIINKNIGEDRGVQLLYGKNIPVDGLSEETSIETVVTRIYPKAYNGCTLSNNGYVDSPLSNNYTPCVHGKVIEFADVKMREDAQENDESNGIIVCDTQEELDNILIQKCNEQFDAGIDKPVVTIKANMILLENTTEYEEYKSLETVSLGDTIYCYHRKLGIETKARVTSLVYDCIRKKTTSVVIGTEPYDYFKETSSVITAADKVIDKENNTLMADKIAGIINLLNTSLRAQKDIAQKQDVRAILFEDLDTDSPTFGALCIGTQGIQIAKERNETNTDWQLGTAIDFQSINADYIITGILTDRNGNFYLDMSNGDLRMKNGTFVGNITGGSIRIGSNFSVDSSGNLTAKGNASFQGNVSGSNISGTNITGGSIKIDNNFSVDSSGNLVAKNANFQGSISGSSISSGTISGTTISGSTISGGIVRTTSSDNVYSVIMQNGEIKWIRSSGGTTSNLTFRPNVGAYRTYSSGDYSSDKKVAGSSLWTTSTLYTQEQVHAEGNIDAGRDVNANNYMHAKNFIKYSDKRLKENIKEVDLKEILDIVNIYEFNFRDKENKTVGVIAQDFIDTKFAEYIISKDDKGYYSVDYDVLFLACIQKVKELEKHLKELEVTKC